MSNGLPRRHVAKRALTWLLCAVIIFTLSACTKSVHKVSYITDGQDVLGAMPQKDDIEPLQTKPAQELVNAGFIYLANRNLKIAELHFTTALSKDPKNVEAFIGLGRTEIIKGNNSAALMHFAKATQLDPHSVPALVGEAQALRFEGRLNAATQKINTAMMIDPENISVLQELAMIYDMTGRENLSAPIYQEIVEKSPDRAASHNNLGLNYMVRGEYPESIRAFLQAYELDRNNKMIKNNLASAYLLYGDRENALKIFTSTVGEAAAYNNIGYLLMTQGEFDEAEKALRTAIAINPRFYVRAQENLDKLDALRKTSKVQPQ